MLFALSLSLALSATLLARSAPREGGEGGQEGLRRMAVKVHLEEGRRLDGGENCNFFDGRVVRRTTWLWLLLLALLRLLTVCTCLLQGAQNAQG